ncbi:related to mouse T10 protein [Rhynchosporium agropyri]|uniref:Related to mouse T10 protein n=1 Tax=Rhynchosporium agropyri TaxID=914238 RepID=A0A1E1LM88_9HELO|nr:related to mouse T10 protein [Rhynchosporium agropyri]
MCIVIATTAHPSYALIIIDNRDEFITRPTSRPHWWTSNHQEILSARDLQRAEQGTWLGITKTGNFAVLTNYRETDTNDAEHPIQGTRSRGGMVTAWLTAAGDESTHEFVQRLMAADGVKGVGGFSLLCGKLRKRRDMNKELEPLAIISNRCEKPGNVPWIAERRGEVYGLSNTSFDDPDVWPKVQLGRDMVLQAVEEVVDAGLGEEVLVSRLFAILDSDTLPENDGREFEEYIYELRKSIFIPSIGSETPLQGTPKADVIAAADVHTNGVTNGAPLAKIDVLELKGEERSDPVTTAAMTGIYGTQRQTIILVDWDGRVTFRERSLWDAKGNPIQRGKGDMKFDFDIEGWNGESKGNEVYPHALL